MKSPLEMNPNKLLVIVFIFALVILPIILIASNIKFNATYGGIIIGLALVVFFFFIYPRITKNKEYLAQMDEDKKAREIIKKQPDFYKVRIVALIALLLMIIVSGFFLYIDKLDYIIYTVPVIVFLYMMYYAKWAQKKKELADYGKKIEKIQVTGITNAIKWSYYGLIIGVIIAIILLFIFIFVLR